MMGCYHHCLPASHLKLCLPFNGPSISSVVPFLELSPTTSKITLLVSSKSGFVPYAGIQDNFDGCEDGGDSNPFSISDDGEQILPSDDAVLVEVDKIEMNRRRIRSGIKVRASLDAIWSVLTDYERLSDVVPSLAVSELVENEDNRYRLFQVGERTFPLGVKFSAKVVLDCYEKELEMLPNGCKRDIDFKMIDGDFQFYEGRWSIEQLYTPEICDELVDEENYHSILWFYVDVKPQPWLPIQLIEGRLCREIKSNLSSLRDESQKLMKEVIS